MPSLPILDVVIGVVFVYLLLSLLCSTVNEMIAGLTKRRARFLDEGVARLFNDAGTKERFYDTPLVQALALQDPKRSRGQRLLDTALGRPREPRPSYIPSDVFALAVRDMITGTTDSTLDVSALQKGLLKTGGPEFQRALAVMIDEARGDVPVLDQHLRKFFDEAMDRVSGWYKRHAQNWSVALAVVMTLVVNADTLKMTHTLWTNPTVRAMAIQAASARRDMDPPPDLLPMVVYTDGDEPEKGTPVELSLTPREQEVMASLTGWGPDWVDYSRRLAERRAARAATAVSGGATPPAPRLSFREHANVFGAWLAGVFWRHGIGWLLTALAVSIGAPFWFDTLKRFMNVRYAGPPPKKAEA